MSYSSRGSGGSGFEGFPFRSPHQQGNDNPRNNNRRKSANRVQNRRKRGGPITCRARFQVPPALRKFLIGSNGATINALTDGTRCVINVPGKKQTENPNAMVAIQASCIDYLLHGCWEVLNIVGALSISSDVGDADCDGESLMLTGPRTEERKMAMKYILEAGESQFRGSQVNFNSVFLTGTSNNCNEMSVYCVLANNETSETCISILVDNARFVDPNIKAQVCVVSRADILKCYTKNKCQQPCFNECPSLVFIYGSKQNKTRELYDSILHGLVELEKRGETVKETDSSK